MKNHALCLVVWGLILLGSGLSQPAKAASIVTEWLDVAIPAAEDATPEPTSSARFFAVLHSAIYEAWAAYDDSAVGIVTGKQLKGTGGTPTIANKREAISHAAYTALMDLAPAHRKAIAAFMAELGYSPAASSSAAVLGHRAAAAVLEMRRSDGSNQNGRYRDTSGYRLTDPADHNSWQPAAVEIMNTKALEPVTPHWSAVTPFALARADEFRPPAPPAFGTPSFNRQVEEMIAISAGLADEQKATAEYWANFISSPPPHLITLTKFVSLRDDYRLDDDVKLFFAISNALLDAGISCWEAKYHYNYVRPYTAIRNLGDLEIRAWDNPNLSAADNHLPNAGYSIEWGRPRGAVQMAARLWLPYLPTPPFPSYVSGHSEFTAAWARTMELITGSAAFGYRAQWPKLFVESRWLEKPVVLEYPTFWSAAEASGMSRLFGGIHWPVDNQEGLAAGRKVGERVWDVAQRDFIGDARPAGSAVALVSPVWQKASAAPGVTLDTQDGLRIAFDKVTGAPSAAWQTVAFDAPAAGRYHLSAVVEVAGADVQPLSIGLRAIDPRPTGATLGDAHREVSVGRDAAAPAAVPIDLDYNLDGTTPLCLVFEARPGGSGTATALLRRLKLDKVDSFVQQPAQTRRAAN